MKATSRRTTRAITTKTGISIEASYCRKCMQTKKATDFYQATDTFLDANGLWSICKECCQEIYDRNFKIENSIERAVYRTCRLLDLKYDPNAVELAKQQIQGMANSGTIVNNFFGVYKAKLSMAQKVKSSEKSGTDMTFQEIDPAVTLSEEDVIFQKSNEDLAHFWGETFTEDEYIWLERELAEWQATHRCDTKAEKSLLREICLTSLNLRKKRGTEGSAKELVKELQELMKTANVDPAKTASANSGKSLETFSAFVKVIENEEPAEYYKDKMLFKDFDGLDFYFKKYITRPLKNFITQSRDFNVEAEDEVDETVDMGEGDGD